jgi:hypothetical protein
MGATYVPIEGRNGRGYSVDNGNKTKTTESGLTTREFSMLTCDIGRGATTARIFVPRVPCFRLQMTRLADGQDSPSS